MDFIIILRTLIKNKNQTTCLDLKYKFFIFQNNLNLQTDDRKNVNNLKLQMSFH